MKLSTYGRAWQVKGEKPPVPTRGLSKRSAGGADDADDVDEDGAAGDAASAVVDLVPRTDIRFFCYCCRHHIHIEILSFVLVMYSLWFYRLAIVTLSSDSLLVWSLWKNSNWI